MRYLIKLNESNRKGPLFAYGFCLLISLVFLLIATKSSPLYPFNDWVDTNASFTMGKAMMHGRVLYRDIFNQKGPLHYFVYGIAYLISNSGFLGVLIFEVLAFSVFLYFSYKIFLLYLEEDYALLSLPILAAIILNLNSFAHGGSPEELFLPFVAIGLYHLLSYFNYCYPKPIPMKWVLINGVFAGCILWSKYSLMGFWFGWMLSIFISLLINHGFLRAIKAALIFLSGMILTTLPWLVYFGVNQSINELINSYFIINLTSYTSSTSVLSPLVSTVLGLMYSLKDDPIGFGLLFFSITLVIASGKFIGNLMSKLSIILCFLFLSVSVFGGGSYFIYYSFIFSPFIIFSIIAVLQVIQEHFGRFKSKRILIISVFLFSTSLIIFTLGFHHNRYALALDRDDFVQYKYASIINQKKDATILNYGVLDLGFYTTTGIIPNVRFFQNQNIDYSRYPLVLDEQNRYLEEKMVDYVVTVIPTSFNIDEIEIPYLSDNYFLIEDQIQEYENKEYYYLLFVKKEEDF